MNQKVDLVNEQKFIRLNGVKLRKLASYVVRREKSRKYQLTVLVCDNKTIQKYHARFFGKRTPTDVISFGMPAKTIEAEGSYLGDVIISAQMAKKVAGEYKQSPHRELERYLVHGILHLLGYDDRNKKDFDVMHRIQEKYLENFQAVYAAQIGRRKA